MCIPIKMIFWRVSFLIITLFSLEPTQSQYSNIPDAPVGLSSQASPTQSSDSMVTLGHTNSEFVYGEYPEASKSKRVLDGPVSSVPDKPKPKSKPNSPGFFPVSLSSLVPVLQAEPQGGDASPKNDAAQISTKIGSPTSMLEPKSHRDTRDEGIALEVKHQLISEDKPENGLSIDKQEASLNNDKSSVLKSEPAGEPFHDGGGDEPSPTGYPKKTPKTVPNGHQPASAQESLVASNAASLEASEHDSLEKTSFTRNAPEPLHEYEKGEHNKKPGNSTLLKDVKLKILNVDMDDIPCDAPRVGSFMHVYKTSKYFIDLTKLYTYARAKETCDAIGLAIADMDGVGDHRTMQTFIGGRSFSPDKQVKAKLEEYFLGMNDIDVEGVYKKGSGMNVTFQTFFRSQPDDKDQAEDCVALTQLNAGGPVGMIDTDCEKKARAICMFPQGTECFRESNETAENMRAGKKGLKLILKIVGRRSYHLSNFQDNWFNSMRYCEQENMTLMRMDNIVAMPFFERIMKAQQELVRVPIPTVEYWTAGKTQDVPYTAGTTFSTQMRAPIFWQKKSEPTSAETMQQGTAGENGNASTFTWSGVFRWSDRKKADPGGPYGHRRDVCISFGFEGPGDATPVIRNTNCELPCFFICAKSERKSAADDDPDEDD